MLWNLIEFQVTDLADIIWCLFSLRLHIRIWKKYVKLFAKDLTLKALKIS